MLLILPNRPAAGDADERFILLHQHPSSCTVPLSPVDAQHEGRWLSWSSQLTRFLQPPLQLSIVAFEAAWCYFTFVGVSVSSRILQWFVTYRYLGFVVHFNS